MENASRCRKSVGHLKRTTLWKVLITKQVVIQKCKVCKLRRAKSAVMCAGTSAREREEKCTVCTLFLQHWEWIVNFALIRNDSTLCHSNCWHRRLYTITQSTQREAFYDAHPHYHNPESGQKRWSIPPIVNKHKKEDILTTFSASLCKQRVQKCVSLPPR